MKWPAFVFSLLLILPASAWLRRNPQYHRIVWGIFGFLPFGLAAIPQLDIALINWAMWPGHNKGILYSAVDAAALTILFALPKSDRPLPFLKPMIFYFAAVLLSAVQATFPITSIFYASQLLRVFLVYMVVARATVDRTVIPPLLTGVAVSLCMQAVIVVYQRFGLGILQTGGSFGHQNLLGLVSNLVVLPLFALLLSGRTGWATVAGPAAGCVIAVLTTSRATLGLAGLGLGLLFVVSSIRHWTRHKALLGLLGMAAVAIAAPIAVLSFEERFEISPIEEGGYDERAAFVKAAKAMLDDHPLGVGANNFVYMANAGGYFDRANVIAVATSRSAHVHNIYWLTAAETGYLGLAALVILLFRPMSAALICGWRHRADRRGDLLLGLGVSLMILYIHSNYEWIFILAPVQYIFAINLGLIAGLTQQLGYWRKADEETPAAVPAIPSPLNREDDAAAARRRQDDVFWGIETPEDPPAENPIPRNSRPET